MGDATDTPKKVGPMPTGRRVNGMPVPFFFHEESAAAFKAMDVAADDVILCSLAKGGTTWVHKLLHLLLRGIGDDGQPVTDLPPLNSKGQIYPEALPLTPLAPLAPGEDLPQMEQVRRQFFGDYCFADLLAQPAPRLFSTHLYGEKWLPTALFGAAGGGEGEGGEAGGGGDGSSDGGGRGRLILVLRNLKDVLCSLHFFRGEAKDGWAGNEHGPGSLARFLHADSPNAYGSVFETVKALDATAQRLYGVGRVCVVYFEALKQRLPSEVARVAAFLGLGELSAAKHAAVVAAVGFQAMKADSSSAHSSTLLRKGEIGDWVNHMGEAEWARFDEAFDDALGDVALAEPLRFFQGAFATGRPHGAAPPRATHSLGDDPRAWPKFVRGTLEEGFLVRDGLIAKEKKNTNKTFLRPASEYGACAVGPPPPEAAAATATAAAAAGAAAAEPSLSPHQFHAEPGRYHLFVSGVCPWASGVRAARSLCGLEGVVGMDVADGQSSAGWVCAAGTSCATWAAQPGPFFLHQAYQVGDPGCTTRITMPLLWDTRTRAIVSNDSWNIVKCFSGAFLAIGAGPSSPLLDPASGLLPPAAADGTAADAAAAMEELHASIYKGLLNGVYRAGVGLLFGNAEGAAAAADEVYATLAWLDERLGGTRFLLGGAVTAVDVRLVMNLLRWDSSYSTAFGLGGGRGGVLLGGGYPHLQGYVRDMYQLAGMAGCVDWASFRQYFRWGIGHPKDEPLPPLEPIIASAEAPHGRAEKFA
jgi:putative glutathione S-transferase